MENNHEIEYYEAKKAILSNLYNKGVIDAEGSILK